jgi:TPR repeat protein
MMERENLYKLGHPDVDPFDENENAADQRVASSALRIRARPDAFSDPSVPLFLSDPDGEPDPRAYLAPLRPKRRASISSRLLMGAVAAAGVAVLFALLSSDAMRNNIVNLRASIAAVLPTPSAAAQSDSSQLTQRDIKLNRDIRPNEVARSPAPGNPALGAGSVTMAAVAPTREEIKNAYQSALQGGALQGGGQPSAAPQVAPPVESTIPPDPIRPLDPDEIASALKRGTALIASGDLAAARLVLHRAAEAGDARAAMMLAETYDPAILAKLGVHGVVPDLVKARGWYEKAKQFGAPEATQRLELLASKQY